MYSFIDVKDASGANTLPSEALKINGVYIENQISGYRTLNVSGREALSPELATYETGIRDGSTLQSRRYPARTITVRYQIIAKTNAAFREAYNQLASILNVENAELIFEDEKDKFFIGTPSAIEEVEPGSNAVVGEFQILCTDPFKYSVNEYEVDTTAYDGLGFTVNYSGTYKAFPVLEAEFYSEEESNGDTDSALTGNGDCGYVAFFNERGKIIQLGNPDEADGEELAKSQTLVNQTFTKSSSWGSAAKKKWAANSGIVSSSSFTQTGNMGLKEPAPTVDPGKYYLTPSSHGTGDSWHGPSITRTIPADASGENGATKFTFTYKQKTCIGNGKNDTKQLGAFQVILSDANGKIVAGVMVFKNKTGKSGLLRFYVNGKTQETMDIDLSYHNKYFGNNTYKDGVLQEKTVKTSSITKTGSRIAFNIGGVKKVFMDSQIASAAVTKITFIIAQHGTRTPLAYNGLYSAKFVKNNCDTWLEIPNKFSTGDVVTADCKTGEIKLNDSRAPELGALGNDWEEFYLENGTNQIGVSYSDWVKDAYVPSFKMRYREVFL